jgi:decaprenyl-phosphate phosphoribosyltransferase
MTSQQAASANRPSLAGHLAIMRVDHWFKNVFVLPGLAVAITVVPDSISFALIPRALLGLLAICLAASSNYVINEILDAPFDKHHPTKRLRPVPSGQVNVSLAYAQWIGLAVVAFAIALMVSFEFSLTIASLWVMGCVYNIKPLRTKDRAYLDVLSESINNPIRMLAGWYIVGPPAITPASLLLFYWMLGCYFMAIKRFAEYRYIDDDAVSATYRKSFRFYSEDRLLTSIMFYASAAMLFFGVFVIRYRLELVISFPVIALAMAIYLNLGLRHNSPTQNPESLYREKGLMLTCALCVVVMVACLVIDMPWLDELVRPLAPTR